MNDTRPTALTIKPDETLEFITTLQQNIKDSFLELKVWDIIRDSPTISAVATERLMKDVYGVLAQKI